MVGRIDAVYDDDEFQAAIVYKHNGAMLFAEIEPWVFREEQKRAERLPVLSEEFRPDPRYLKLFDAILDLFQKYPVKLVVNEWEDAPYAYTTPENYGHYRVFMKKIRGRVEEKKIPYILSGQSWGPKDSDYYDSSHLNFDGAVKYSAGLAGRLKTVLK